MKLDAPWHVKLSYAQNKRLEGACLNALPCSSQQKSQWFWSNALTGMLHAQPLLTMCVMHDPRAMQGGRYACKQAQVQHVHKECTRLLVVQRGPARTGAFAELKVH
eukprot:scaffold89352_cov24-Tisochrysis_lutea.AAC.1